ncbi:tRNA modification GTPase MnmE [Trichinella spiralis]|uniref:tRNA modification GTPase MnmE n=1 Tax=Trichinella spiralis TaxID=6334 RepID=A0ABR3K596_TRISP
MRCSLQEVSSTSGQAERNALSTVKTNIRYRIYWIWLAVVILVMFVASVEREHPLLLKLKFLAQRCVMEMLIV